MREQRQLFSLVPPHELSYLRFGFHFALGFDAKRYMLMDGSFIGQQMTTTVARFLSGPDKVCLMLPTAQA